jgi:hypothetical protein
MARIEYRSKEFPELAKLRIQVRGLALVQGKTMSQVFTEALQLWMKHNYGEGMNQWYQIMEREDGADMQSLKRTAANLTLKNTINKGLQA